MDIPICVWIVCTQAGSCAPSPTSKLALLVRSIHLVQAKRFVYKFSGGQHSAYSMIFFLTDYRTHSPNSYSKFAARRLLVALKLIEISNETFVWNLHATDQWRL